MTYPRYKILLPIMIALVQFCGAAGATAPLESVRYTPSGMYRPLQIEVDGQNRKWMRSSGGVHMYDGSTWSRFVSGNDLPGSVQDIYIDSHGDVWLATNGGIAKWNGSGWDVIDTEDGIKLHPLQQIYVTDEGIVWACATNMLYRFDGTESRHFSHSHTRRDNISEMIVTDEENGETIWLLNEDMNLYKSTSWTDSSASIVGIKTNVSMLLEHDGELLIGNDSYVYSGLGSQLLASNPVTNVTRAVVFDDRDYIWFFGRSIACSRGGIGAVLKVREDIIPEDSYQNIYYEDAAIDHDGVIWVVGGDGVLSFDTRFLVLISPPPYDPGNPPDMVKHLPGDTISIRWFSKDIGKLELSMISADSTRTLIASDIDPESARYDWRIPGDIIPVGQYTTSLLLVLSSEEGIVDTSKVDIERVGYSDAFTDYPIGVNGVIDACQTPEGNMCFIDYYAVYIQNDFMWTRFNFQAEDIVSGSDGGVWVRTDQDIMRYKDGKWEHLFHDRQINHRLTATPDGDVWVFCEEYLPNEGSWYKHYYRLYRYHDGEWTDEWEQLGLDRFYVEDFGSSLDGKVWIWGNELGEGYNMDTCLMYDSTSDEWRTFLFSISPRELFWDNQGNMWNISNEDTDTLYKYVDGEWTAYPVNPEFGHRYGEIRFDFVLADTGNRLWFNSDNGILMFDGESWSQLFIPESSSFRLVYIDRNGIKWLENSYSLVRFDKSTVGVESASQPETFALGQPYPNPFNPTATIPFHLQEPVLVEIAIYSIDGRLVRELRSGWMAAGEHELRWDSRDDRGDPVSSGVYLCRLRAGNRTAVRRMTLVR